MLLRPRRRFHCHRLDADNHRHHHAKRCLVFVVFVVSPARGNNLNVTRASRFLFCRYVVVDNDKGGHRLGLSALCPAVQGTFKLFLWSVWLWCLGVKLFVMTAQALM